MRLVGTWRTLAELFDALDRRAVVLEGAGLVRAAPGQLPPGYVSESWVDGYEERYGLRVETGAPPDSGLIELFDEGRPAP